MPLPWPDREARTQRARKDATADIARSRAAYADMLTRIVLLRRSCGTVHHAGNDDPRDKSQRGDQVNGGGISEKIGHDAGQ